MQTAPLKVSADTRRRIAGHIANLGSPDDETALRAEARLMRFGARAVPQILAMVSGDSPQVRFRAAWVLGKSGDPLAYPALTALTEDADEAVRYDATLALGELGDGRAVPFLKALAQRVPSEDCRVSAAMSALVKLKGCPAIEDFVQGIGVTEIEAADVEWARFFRDYWREELTSGQDSPSIRPAS